MFFDGIGIDLFFPFEGDVKAAEVAQVFNQYYNAGQQLHPNGTTLVGAFLLNEVGRCLQSYGSPYTDANQATDNNNKEVFILETTHTYGSGRFLARVWRPASVLSNDQEDSIVIRVLRRDGAEDLPNVVHESDPVPFPANQSSILIDAGFVEELPQGELSIMIKRPSEKRLIVINFKYQEPGSHPTNFSGVLRSGLEISGFQHPRMIAVGSEDGRRLNQFISAYIRRSDLEQAPAGQPHPQAAVPATSPRSNEEIIPFDHAERDNSLAQPIASPQDPSSVQASPQLSTRGWTSPWHALANLAAHITPTRTLSVASSSSALEPSLPMSAAHERNRAGTTAEEQYTDAATQVPHDESTDANKDAEVNPAKDLGNLLENINSLLADASNAIGGNHWTDMVSACQSTSANVLSASPDDDGTANKGKDRAVGSKTSAVNQGNDQTGQHPQEPRLVGVSYDIGTNADSSSNQATDALIPQYLVLPTGSGSARTHADPANHGTPNNGENHTHSRQTQGDVEMEDVPAATPQNTDAFMSVPLTQMEASTPATTGTFIQQTDTLPHCGQPDPVPAGIIDLTQPASGTEMNCQGVAASEMLADDMQVLYCSRGVGPDDQAVPNPTQNDRSSPVLASDIPLAAQVPTFQGQADEMAPSQSGTLARLAERYSRHGTPSVAGMRSHRHASPAPSATSMVSTASTFRPSNERFAELLNYMVDIVKKDKSQDDVRCVNLLTQREADERKFDAIRSQYVQTLSNNNYELDKARASSRLKRDTLRLLRSQYNAHVAGDVSAS